MPTILQDIRTAIVALVVRRKDLRGTKRAASPSFPDEVDGTFSGADAQASGPGVARRARPSPIGHASVSDPMSEYDHRKR